MSTAEAAPASAGVFPDYPTLLPKPLTERQAGLLARARELAKDFATRADTHDRENSFPFENYERMKASGYGTMTLGAKYGGEDVTLLELCACQEQLAQGCGGTAIGVNMHLLTMGALQDEARRTGVTDPMQEMMFTMTGGQRLISSGSFSETGAAGAYLLPQTTATRVEGGWRVNGRKSYNSNLPQSDFVGGNVTLVGHPDGENLMAMVFLPKETPGVKIAGAESWDVMSVRASGRYDVVFEDAFVPDLMMQAPIDPANAFVGQAAFGAWFQISVASVYLGIAQAAVDWVTDYVKTRKPQTEERTLAHMPGIQYQLAEMLALMEASRAIIATAAQDYGARRWTPEDTASRGGIVKYIVSNNNLRVLDLAMDIAGGPGLFRRFGLERLYRDVRGAKAHPPSDVNALEVIAKGHLGIARDFSPRWG